ncbi:alpha/beta fold hydrolase [bacterium]|nr:alpha/beta fold hydrolase [bacterium]
MIIPLTNRISMAFFRPAFLFVLFPLLFCGCGPHDDHVRILGVEYSRPAGEPLKFDFVRPQGNGPFPLVVCIHGGGWRKGDRSEYAEFQSTMAGKGVATVSVQYRLAPDAKFPVQLEDIRNALQFVLTDRKRFPVDPKRVMWLGGSAGGHLALLAGFEKRDDFETRLIVNVAGPADLRTFKSLPSGDANLKKYVTRDSSELLADLLGTADRTADIYRIASPVEHLRPGGPRVLTLHGDQDDIVPISQSEALHAKLREMQVPEKLIRIPGGGHDMGAWNADERLKALIEVVDAIEAEAQK